MTESLSYGRLPLMQMRTDLNIKSDSLHLIKLTTSSYLSSFLRAILKEKELKILCQINHEILKA